jgi:hypothetical protein
VTGEKGGKTARRRKGARRAKWALLWKWLGELNEQIREVRTELGEVRRLACDRSYLFRSIHCESP